MATHSTTMMDAGNQAALALLDMTAAFDHEIILERMRRSYGVSGLALAWLTSYLSGRTASVSLQNLQSSSYSSPHGVHQGSVLGPLLFILYVADIAGITDRHVIQSHFYADDAQLYLTCRRTEAIATASRLTSCIDEIAQWLASNRLMLNPAKTDLLWCTTKGCPPDVSVSPCGINV